MTVAIQSASSGLFYKTLVIIVSDASTLTCIFIPTFHCNDECNSMATGSALVVARIAAPVTESASIGVDNVPSHSLDSNPATKTASIWIVRLSSHFFLPHLPATSASGGIDNVQLVLPILVALLLLSVFATAVLLPQPPALSEPAACFPNTPGSIVVPGVTFSYLRIFQTHRNVQCADLRDRFVTREVHTKSLTTRVLSIIELASLLRTQND